MSYPMPNSPLSSLKWKWCSIILLLENSGIQKGALTPCIVQYNPADVLYSTLFYRILRSYYLVCILLIMMSVSLLYHKHVRPATVVALCFLPLRRLLVTTGRGSLVLLDKLNALSNFGSFSMMPLRLF